MKRSTQIGLAAAGVVLVATVWSLSGDNAQDDLVYASPAECKAGGQLSAEACEAAFADASAKRLSAAPKFQRQSDCEAQYGASGCSSASIGGAQYFIPALAGFMLARSLSGSGTPQAQPLLPPTRAACPPGSAQPECQAQSRSSSSTSGGGGGGGSRSRAYSTASGQNFTATGDSTSGMKAPSTSSRGGFGSTSRSYSSSSSS